MNNQVGYAPVAEFGDRLVLGTDGIGADMFEEARLAFWKGRDARSAIGLADWVKALARGQRMGTQTFELKLGVLDVGCASDLVVVDYNNPTPLSSDNLAEHLIFGMNSSMVESVMVNGRFIIRERRSSLDEEDLYGRAREAAERLWGRLARM
jgi:cytosine/adenosine deaminase-related metal-dependent hydrolase